MSIELLRPQIGMVLVGRSAGQWRALLMDQLSQDRQPKVAHEVQLYSTALALVRQGLGATVLPRHAGMYLDRCAFTVRPLISPGTRWSTYWIARKRSMVDPAALAELRRAIDAVLKRSAPGARPPVLRPGRR